MTASIHKLTAGDGYTYLTRQVARMDATHEGGGLDAYYTERGETPGVWLGAGLSGLGREGAGLVLAGSRVTEDQMLALFGEGRHPNASAIEKAIIEGLMAAPVAARGRYAGQRPPVEVAQRRAMAATALGRRYAQIGGASPFDTACAIAFREANAAAGRVWSAALPAQERATIRTRVAREMFTAEHGRDPGVGELDRWMIAASQSAAAVAGYDITFSPVKSVSALWAVAPPAVAAHIQAAHEQAVKDVLGWIEQQVAYTRVGAGGVRQVDVRGVVAAAFTHRDSRAGDPDLHTHVAIANKVQTLDGRWLSLDGRVLFKAMVAASERYNTQLETLLTTRLGVRFEDVPQPDRSKRPVREIVGIPPQLRARWSSRRAVIERAQAELVGQFQRDHGRLPTKVEAIRLAQQATLSTRERKHEPRSEAEQRDVWAREAADVLGGPDGIRAVIGAALTGRQHLPEGDRAAVVARLVGADARLGDEVTGLLWRADPALPQEVVHTIAGRVTATVSGSRARWQIWHVRAEAERRIRLLGASPERTAALVDRVTAAAVSPAFTVRVGQPDPVPEPAELRRLDGSSVYEVAGSTLYTSPAILAAEQYLVGAAAVTGGRQVDPHAVDLALLESMANGLTLNPAQAAMVRDLATSGRRVQLTIAPAGTGKTTGMRVLASAWTATGGTIIGLAPTAVAAKGLGQEIDAATDTLASLTFGLATGVLPAWTDQVDDRTLVVIDEAGMAGTQDLATGVEWILSRGASVRLVGDDQQLAAIAAGGVLRDIAVTAGAATLGEPVRFHDPAEAAAGLALREGDPMSLGFYLDRGRIHIGDAGTTTDSAYDAWVTDRSRGLDAVMLAPTREQVLTLNMRAQADWIALSGVDPGPGIRLSDSATAHVGDIVVTRMNDRRLAITATDFVKNGDRWTVEDITPDGRVKVRHLRLRRAVMLPADYVAEHTELGYASTVHGAQGITADACHTVVAGSESRQLLYVALTRGRASNHVYVAAGASGDLHDLTRPDATGPLTDLDVLAAIVARDGSQESATTAARDHDSPARQLHRAAARYRDAVPALAARLLDHHARDLTDHAEQLLAGVTTSPAWDTLRDRLVLSAVGHRTTPAQVLAAAIAAAALSDGLVDDPAAVLASRIPAPSGTAPLPWLPAVPADLAAHPQWGTYVRDLGDLVDTTAATVASAAATWTDQDAPAWANPLLTGPPDLRRDIAVWRAVTDVPDTDRDLVGPPRRGPEGAWARTLRGRVLTALPTLASSQAAWRAIAEQIDPRLLTDPTWATLVDRMEALARTGIDAPAVFRTAAAEAPIPAEYPAASLWWRIARHLPTLTPAVAARPDWATVLTTTLGAARAEKVLTDPLWPTLVAAVDHAVATGWTPEQVLHLAIDATRPDLAIGEGGILTSDLARALTAGVAGAATIVDPYADVPVWLEEPPLVDDDPVWDDTTTVPADLADPTIPPAPMPDAVDDDPGPGEVDPIHELRTAAWDRALADLVWPAPPPSPAVIPPESHARITALNAAAHDFYTAALPGSWAATYLADRLPTVPVDAGVAPAGWTTLIDHLRATTGATDQELLTAGLARTSSRGTLIDAYRDRLVLPIRDEAGAIIGFTARRNPTAGDTAGPKYLNTIRTDAYDKSSTLYGIHAFTDHPRAIPVIVEGALDAAAVTAAGGGRYIGLAPLGTALTPAHVDQIRRTATTPTVLVATDADRAGRKAARRDYDLLTAADLTPRGISLPEGADPADHLARHGTDALTAALDRHEPLINDLIDHTADTVNLAAVSERLWAARHAAGLIAVLPPTQWPDAIDRLTDRLDIAPATSLLLVAETATEHALNQRLTRPIHDPTATDLTPGARAELQAALNALAARTTPAPRPRTPAPRPEPQTPPPAPVPPAHHDPARRPHDPSPGPQL